MSRRKTRRLTAPTLHPRQLLHCQSTLNVSGANAWQVLRLLPANVGELHCDIRRLQCAAVKSKESQ